MATTKEKFDLLVGSVLKTVQFWLDGTQVTSSAAELNILDGATLDVNELNILDGVTATAAELNGVDLSAVGALAKVKKIHVAAGDWSSETDSAWDLPAKSLVLDVFIDVTTLQAGKTVDVGLLSSESGGDADGFLVGVSLAATGIVRGLFTFVAGTNTSYISASTLGVLLYSGILGGDLATTPGTVSRKAHPSTAVTAKSVSYTTSTSVTAVFDIYVVYIELG